MDDHHWPLSPFDRAMDVVILRAENGLTVPAAGAIPITLADETEPTAELLTELLDSTVRLTTAEGIPVGVMEVLHDIPVPPAFRSSPWLADSRPVIVRDGIGRVGPLPLRYTDNAGLDIDFPHSDGQNG